MRFVLLLAFAGALSAQDGEGFGILERLEWAGSATLGPPNLAAGVFTSGIQTWRNDPPEYGPHWDGFGKRYGLRLTGNATSNVMEAGLGSLWGEDPRYRPMESGSFKRRAWHAIKGGFVAQNRAGDTVPAYARYAAVSGGNVISNAWRPDSQRTAGNTTVRIGLGFVGRIAANSFTEFWPDVKRLVFH